MRFVVDGMLGGLARWLRMLGHNVLYESNASDNALLALAARDQFVLLTRDEELYHRALARKIPALLVTGQKEEERLAELARKCHISLAINMALTRCPECGASLLEASREEIANRVPPASLKIYTEFWKCENPNCEKIYWMGSHWKQINQTLTRARRLLDRDA